MSRKITIDFTGVHSARQIENELRADPITFIGHVSNGKRLQILGEEVRVGNKGSMAIYLSDFHWHSYEDGEHGLGLIDLAGFVWGIGFKETLPRCAAFLKNKSSSTAYKPVARKTCEEQEQVKLRKKRRALN